MEGKKRGSFGLFWRWLRSSLTWACVRVVGFWSGVRTTRLSPVWKAPLPPPPLLWFFPLPPSSSSFVPPPLFCRPLLNGYREKGGGEGEESSFLPHPALTPSPVPSPIPPIMDRREVPPPSAHGPTSTQNTINIVAVVAAFIARGALSSM